MQLSFLPVQPGKSQVMGRLKGIKQALVSLSPAAANPTPEVPFPDCKSVFFPGLYPNPPGTFYIGP